MALASRSKGLLGQLSQARNRLIEEHLAGLPGALFVARYTSWVEEIVRRLFNEQQLLRPRIRTVSLVALGGFGRGELNLNSDVDLMFLYPAEHQDEVEKLAEQVLYPLWDLGLEVGHATRTMDDCLKLAGGDFQVLVSMLTARPLAGDTSRAKELEARLKASLTGPKARRRFFDQVVASDLERQARFGRTPYLLEPHLKEGEGGLRDIHAVTWVGLGCFSRGRLQGLAEEGLLTDTEVAFIGEARDFLWRVRNHLHYLARSRDDRLTFERQEKIAAFLGFKDEGGLNRVQQFMRAYYTRVFGLRNIRNLFFERALDRINPAAAGEARTVEADFVARDGELHLARPETLAERPGLMMKLFAAAARSGLVVSHQARQEVGRRLYLVDEAFRADPAVRDEFWAVVLAPDPEVEALLALHGSGLLNAYLPEFAGVFQLPQNDAYHLYTVDVHQLLTVGRLHGLAAAREEAERDSLARRIMAGLQRPRLLFAAGLLHDLGKARGGGHAQRGAEMVGPILERLGLNPEEIKVVASLIANHLFLAETAARRDIHDEKLLFQAARQVGDEERLDMLYLLTIADSQATGPRAWSTWQATLIQELYLKMTTILTRPDIDSLRSPEWFDQLRGQVIERLAGRLPAEEVARRLDSLPDQHLLATPPESLAQQIVMLAELKGRPMRLEVEERDEEGYCLLTVVAKARRGHFGRMAGVLTLNGLNILGAQISNTTENQAILAFQVEFPVDPLSRAEKWAGVERDMERVLSGRLALSVRLQQRRAQTALPASRAPRRPTAVTVDNGVSDFHTVIEVATHDRLGLLYDITRVFFDLDLIIHVAKISTKVDQVLDVFYVTDLDLRKIEGQDQIKEIQEALTAALR